MHHILLKALASGLIMSLFPYAAISAPPKPAQTDSLLTLLPKTPDAADRGRIYVQLADLSGDSLELAAPYWEAALAEAHKAGDTYGCKDALDFLVRKFADRDTRRAEKYIALSDSILPGSRHALFRSSLYAYYLWKQMNDNNSIETVTRALEELKGKNYDRLTPEERIEWEFLTGLAIDFSSVTTEAYDNIAKAIPYVERALENLRKYPLEERLHLEKICHDELSDLYMLCKDKRAEEQIGQCIDLHRKWLAMDDRFERPHRDTTGYMMRAYAKMVYLRDLISRDKLNEYYQKCIGLARARGDMAEIYSTSARYYQCTGDYERAVAYIDSTITAYKSKGIKADLAPIYATQSYLYEKMGDYKNALKAVRTTNNIRFNERVEEAQSSLAEMQTLFEVGRLEFEKSRLTGRIRFIALLAGGILVLLLIGWSVYQYVMLELSRLVSSEEPLPLAETDLGLLCAERLQIQRELSQNPSVEYVLKGGGRGTCVIPTNETYMTRVIDNLLQNAAKFTAAGSVTVCCDKDDRTRKLRIRVTDTGIGIAPDKQEWVFDRFTKVDSFKPGSGIGLYLCRLIVTRLGGAIRVCPDYRAGCCIEITLPY